jgi:hypothetical protein
VRAFNFRLLTIIDAAAGDDRIANCSPFLTSDKAPVANHLAEKMSSLIQPSPKELKGYVFTGVWKRCDEGPWSSSKWTLGNFFALLVMAGLTALIALAQPQCWAIVRYIIAQYKKSVRIPGDSTPDPLLKLSQGKAIQIVRSKLSEFLSRILSRVRRKERSTRPPDDHVESSFFGFASIMVIVVFLVIGFVVPWVLTEGALGTPIVKSKIAEECIKAQEPERLIDIWNREIRADEIFSLCRDELNAGCDSPYWLSTKPQITKTRPTTCPFKGGICHNNTPSFEITHWNVSAFEMGINSPSKIRVNHRFTCSPISLIPFQWRFENGSIIYVQKYGSDLLIRPNVSLVLSTMNGPNEYYHENSGALMFEANGPWDLTVLPRNHLDDNFYQPEPFKLNELLQRNDSRPFLVIHRAGDAQYTNAVNDPFFSAHHLRDPNGTGTCADYEATGLGCIEQFQYCFSPSQLPVYCTDWGAVSYQSVQMRIYLLTQYLQANKFEGDFHSVYENSHDQHILAFNEMSNFERFPSRFGVYEYLLMRIEVHNMVPLRHRKSLHENIRWLDSDIEQWVLEVETWFMKAYLNGILAVQDGAMFTWPNLYTEFSSEYNRNWKLCGRILFHNQDYTNINWIGFWMTNASLLLTILVGYQIERIHNGMKYCTEGVLHLKSWAEHLWRTRRRARQSGQGWNVASLFASLNRVRPWPGSRTQATQPNATSNPIELGDVEVRPLVRTEDASSANEEQDIDNTL